MKAEVCFRRQDGRVEARPRESVAALSLQSATPWRTFRWYSGRKHYSGTYGSATVRDHVIHESRLELARLLFADLDPSVRGIVAQPFLLKAEVEGTVRKHIPDYPLTCEGRPVVVDVKPRDRLSKPVVASTFAWTRQAVESRGWRYEVWSEPPSAEPDNVRFLAGDRRDWLFSPELLQELRRFPLDGVALKDVARCVPGRAKERVRAAIHHLLWKDELRVDPTRPLGPATVLWGPA
ncbi:TnsA-like heteromeric transposase endonuclease subunit [Streptomyces calidiresistens]|uniref:TnsA-like heteromeric transposase endonuclease subunit n=1 Tax=Streptomyces calidiresistens TaxID=1485586 RepID=A0A7W3XVD2_9ACTN|nr:TnsA-like heteromeric transposase endonuclease subunit [Streptomyces calidiresistens]MBB0228651.1 TnsA-like heteromeric transposase endonuclease subunit [Streptomyces calidiresistens]